MSKNALANTRLVPLLSACLISALFLTSCSAGESKGLVACWKFEEGKGNKLLDTSGHGNHGTIHGATWAKGRVGGCLKFDGVDDYVDVPKSASLNKASEEVTLMCWIKTPLTGNRYSILERWLYEDSVNERCLKLRVSAEKKNIGFALSSDGESRTWPSSSGTIPADKWVHLAATSDGETMRIYIDGRQDPSTCPSPAVRKIHKSASDLHIGVWFAYSKWIDFFKGTIDEVKIYSRALKSEEILQHYLKESPRGMIAGVITDVNSNPIRGAKVNAGPFGSVSDKEGKYTMSVSAKTYDVKFARKGFKKKAIADTKVEQDRTTKANIKLVKDETPPVISDATVVDITGATATVIWKTNEAANSIVRYGTASKKYNTSARDTVYAKSHRITLTGLPNGTTYYFAVESSDDAENTTTSKELTFTTRKVKHPFLIVKESGYPALRARAAKSPWKEMKAEAIAYIKTHSFNPKGDLRVRCGQMTEIAGAGALAYILDPDNKTLYKDKIADALIHWGEIHDDLMTVSRGNVGHEYWVLPGTAIFSSALALDIIYNDLTPAQRADIEDKLDKMSDRYWTWGGLWPLNTHGVRGVWALYRDDPRIELAIKDYRNRLYSLIGPDGVFDEGPGYAGARLGHNRHAKVHFMDVLEFTGRSKFYSDPRIINFHEWFYGYSVSPFNRYCSFGDTRPNRNYHKGEAATFRAYRFSKRAARYAAWSNEGEKPKGRLLYYVLMGQALPKGEFPPSRIFPDGGAFFRENNPSDRSLAGALWNCKFRGWHSHKDVNAVHLSAYGEHVLRNSGYTGAGKGAHGFSWRYVNHTAVSNNVILIDETDHATKIGGGITEGFTSPRFDFACGYSADALGNGKHLRNFCFVHPQDRRCGYWVLFDEVKADKASSKVNVALHPNSKECSTISDKQEYTWKIGPFTYSEHDVFVTVYLGTPPDSVNIKDGLLARMGGEKNCFVGKYLYSTYDTDAKGGRNIVTVLFPHDADHPKAGMSRISGDAYTGAKVDMGDSVTDFAIESDGKKAVKCDGVSFRGLAALYRLKGEANTFYFVRKGRSFDDGAKPRRGFESDADVSVYAKDKQGRIISPGAEVTFYYPGITGVLLDGKAVPVISSGNGWVKVKVTQGTHDLRFRVAK